MTSLSRRKRRTTVRRRNTRIATWASLACLLAGITGPAAAQQAPAPAGRPPAPGAGRYSPPPSGPAQPAPVPGARPGAPPSGASRYTPPARPPAAPAVTPPVRPALPPPAQSGRTFYYTKPQQPVRPAAVQQPELPAGPAAPYEIRLEPPGPEELFRLESEAALRERLRQEARQRGRGDDVDEFPEEPVLSAVAYQGRSFPPYTRIIEPNYVCYRRLYFHQVNHERYGWDLGFITPVVSAGKFFWDVVRLPHDFASRPHCRYECSAGYCYPGDPVPYLLYPPGFTPLGLAAELGFATGLALIFP